MLISSVLAAGHVHEIEHDLNHNDRAHFAVGNGYFDPGKPVSDRADDVEHMEAGADHYDNCLAYHVTDHQQSVYTPSFDFGAKLIAHHQTAFITTIVHYQQRTPPARAPPAII